MSKVTLIILVLAITMLVLIKYGSLILQAMNTVDQDITDENIDIDVDAEENNADVIYDEKGDEASEWTNLIASLTTEVDTNVAQQANTAQDVKEAPITDKSRGFTLRDKKVYTMHIKNSLLTVPASTVVDIDSVEGIVRQTIKDKMYASINIVSYVGEVDIITYHQAEEMSLDQLKNFFNLNEYLLCSKKHRLPPTLLLRNAPRLNDEVEVAMLHTESSKGKILITSVYTMFQKEITTIGKLVKYPICLTLVVPMIDKVIINGSIVRCKRHIYIVVQHYVIRNLGICVMMAMTIMPHEYIVRLGMSEINIPAELDNL